MNPEELETVEGLSECRGQRWLNGGVESRRWLGTLACSFHHLSVLGDCDYIQTSGHSYLEMKPDPTDYGLVWLVL